MLSSVIKASGCGEGTSQGQVPGPLGTSQGRVPRTPGKQVPRPLFHKFPDPCEASSRTPVERVIGPLGTCFPDPSSQGSGNLPLGTPQGRTMPPRNCVKTRINATSQTPWELAPGKFPGVREVASQTQVPRPLGSKFPGTGEASSQTPGKFSGTTSQTPGKLLPRPLGTYPWELGSGNI